MNGSADWGASRRHVFGPLPACDHWVSLPCGRRIGLCHRGLRCAVSATRRAAGALTLLVAGGAQVITSMLGAGLVDRLVVGIAPTIIGAGTEAVGTLGITTVVDGIRLVDRSVYVLDDDMLLAWDVARCR